MLLQKKNEERQKELNDYQMEAAQKKDMTQEEEKNERIKKGLAAMKLGKDAVDQEQQNNEKRKNLMHEIRDALISGEEGAQEIQKKKKKKPE